MEAATPGRSRRPGRSPTIRWPSAWPN